MAEVADPEVPERAKRRRFAASYKLAILDERDRATIAPANAMSGPEVMSAAEIPVAWARTASASGYVRHCNEQRPHRSLALAVPEAREQSSPPSADFHAASSTLAS